MGKTQVNFRIDEALLEAIKGAANDAGIPYTQWITDTCQARLSGAPLPEQESSDMADLKEKVYELDQRLKKLSA